jgi:hypothetical protein
MTQPTERFSSASPRPLRPGGVLALEILGADPSRASLPADRSIAVVAAEREDDAMLNRIRFSADVSRR